MRAIHLSALLILATACGTAESAQWLEGVGFEWDFFNHRLSYAELEIADDAANIVIVGGTSTTGEPADLTDSCDPDETPGALNCDEFPFTDFALVDVAVGRAESKTLTSGLGSIDLIVGADGESGSLTIELSRRPKGDVIALIHGLVVDTDEPLSGGPSCYKPEFGWHPRRLAIVLGEPAVDGTVATVPVQAFFEAGNSLEEERQCVDAVADQARVALRIGVQIIAANGDAVHSVVSHGQTFTYGNRSAPDEQLPPDRAERGIDVGFDGPIGWSALDFRFHVDDAEDRGAYLRSLSFQLHPELGAASGEATNYSPSTQLSGFDYTFSGTVSALPVGLEVERRRAQELVEIETTDTGYDTMSVPFEAAQ